MAFASFDLLGAVVTALFSAHAGRLDRLAVHYGCAGLGVSLQADPNALTEGGVHPLPRPIQTPEAEVVVDGLPWWEVVGQQSPGTATANYVEDGVYDLAGALCSLGRPVALGPGR